MATFMGLELVSDDAAAVAMALQGNTAAVGRLTAAVEQLCALHALSTDESAVGQLSRIADALDVQNQITQAAGDAAGDLATKLAAAIREDVDDVS